MLSPHDLAFATYFSFSVNKKNTKLNSQPVQFKKRN
jgi:hypothetical protein